MIAIALTLLGAIPIPHIVYCRVQCEPVTRRFVAAPFDARLLTCQVDVGQSVQQHQLLAQLDGSDIRAQLAGLHAKLSQSGQRRSAALAKGDASNAELERWEVQHVQREIEILEHRQQSLEIRSPIDGVVVSGDLRRSEGATLAVGEALFEIAPLDGLIAEIAVPEADITFVQSGMPASIALEATPGVWYTAQIQRIHPRNELRDNASVYIAEAKLENATSQLRPGMQGSARVRAGFEPLAWILFHKPIESIRQLAGW